MQFTADLKLGHYMKVPPQPMFWCQVCIPNAKKALSEIPKVVATIIAGTVQLGVQSW
jgi:hypothetical protein